MRSGMAVFALALLLGGCSGAPATGNTANAATTASPAALNILAASSLKGALEKVQAAYEASHAGITLSVSTDSSAALETKIEQGAPADLFLSADTSNPAKLVDGGFADGAAVTFADNELTVIVPKDNPAGIRSPADLAKAGIKVIAAGDEVPITKYATQLVQNLATQPGYPPGFVMVYGGNVVSMEENVKAVVAKIALGQGDAAIVYATDARASGDVLRIDIPVAANVRASYAGVVVRGSAQGAAAKGLLDWLAGPEGQRVLAAFGFLPPSA